jgi:2-C-methyl-D-erythritol 2,4-cyclodiphosphate synthase
MTAPRVGLGIDLHPSDPARPLWLGGVRFDGEAGLAGHSDGDVICHAVADALLGAAGLGDLGEHFPETDPRWSGVGGLDLLHRTVRLVSEHGLVPVGFDLTFVAERPRIGGHREDIRANLARMLGVSADRASVKATRPEGLGWSGDGAGCIAVVTVTARDGE